LNPDGAAAGDLLSTGDSSTLFYETGIVFAIGDTVYHSIAPYASASRRIRPAASYPDQVCPWVISASVRFVSSTTSHAVFVSACQ
jgi:hypothetical protein